jgi:hypothetical protein
MHLGTRLLGAAFAALLLLPATTPAVAGPSENAFLERLIGTWKGAGRITGPDGGNVSCRLTFKPSGARLNYTGRCALSGGGGAQSFTGSIRFNDNTGRYESSSAGKTVAGKKNGSSLVFTTAQKDMRGTGTSTMSLSARAISVKFGRGNRKGEAHRGSIPFTKG